jgi:hypothetical protein
MGDYRHANSLHSVTHAHTDQSRTTSRKSYKSTTFQITAHDKNSKSQIAVIPGILLSRLSSRFQKAIKKVRAVQRMRRNRGFAFSQTETAGAQDQARLIRAYDTSKSHARPSGY